MAARKAPRRYVVAGRTVPYITRWSVEADERRRRIAAAAPDATTTVDVVMTPQGRRIAAYDIPGTVDAAGWWWAGEPDLRGRGQPEWAQVHGGRQRSCMRNFRCQVCARDLRRPLPETPMVWVTATTEPIDHHGTPATVDAPTCSPCALEALDACPRLASGRRAFWLVRDADTRTVVRGYVRTPVSATDVRQVAGLHNPDKWALATVVAQQQAALFTDAEPLEADRAIAMLTEAVR